MRALSSDIITKSAQQNQTIAADAEPYVSLRVSRNRSVLEDMNLTEKVRVRRLDPNTITDGDVAVCHPRYRGENTKIWCCYLDEGKLRVRWVYDREDITEEKWTVVHAGAPNAIACAICFDSQVVENARGIAEFVTGSENPLVFYVTPDGELKVIILGGAIIEETLAAENVTDVSAVRGPSSKNGSWDLGLTVFFLMGGQLYYRQLINGVWYDAELVNLGIENETIVKIDAFNTWDYRVGVQCLTQSGKLYQLITYTEGIGVRGTNHIEMGIHIFKNLMGITYHNKFINDHIEMGVTASSQTIYGLSAIPISVSNIEDSNENWGTTIQVVFDYPVYSDNVSASMFTLVDDNGNNYLCDSFTISDGGTGRVLTLTFDDFNLAGLADDITLTYTKPSSGGLMSPAVQTDSFTETFVPVNLIPPAVNPPTYASARNNNKGTKIFLYLTEPYTNVSLTGMDEHFSVGCQEYNYVPGGELENTGRSVISVNEYEGLDIDLANGSLTDTAYDNGVIKLEVDTSG